MGSAFQQSAVTNNLQTSFVKQGGDFSGAELQALVVAVIASVATMGTAASLMDTTILNLTLPQAIIAAAASGMISSTVSQAAMMNGVSLGAVLDAGAVSAITAGLTDGITYNSTTGELGFTPLDQGLGSLPQNVSTLGQLAGITSVGSQLAGTVSQATASTAADLPTELAATVADATISAGVQTAIEGGSFLNNLKTDAVNDAAADAAFAIGSAGEDPNSILASGSPGYILAHAAVGCAASAALGTGCAGGAIGAAVSSAFTSQISNPTDSDGNALPFTSGESAALTVASMLLGGAAAGVAGANAQAGATAAENEVMNNRILHVEEPALAQQISSESGGQYTTQQVENQMALMGYQDSSGDTESGGATTVLGSAPSDGTTWITHTDDAGMTYSTQELGSANPTLQQFILQNTNDLDVPLTTQYSLSPGVSLPSSSTSLSLRAPDFVNFQIDYYVGSVWGTFTRDGNSFVGGGLNLGVPNPTGVGANVSVGYLNTLSVSPGQTNAFASGYSGGLTALYDGYGGGIMVSPGNGTATVLGFGAGVNVGKTNNPISLGGGYSVNQGNTGIKW